MILLLICTALLFAFATYNGKKNVKKRLNDISKMQENLQKKDSALVATLQKIEKGQKTDVPRWQLPSEPMTIGYRNPRLAIMQPEKLSFLSTGQSDMYTHFKSPTVYGNNFALDYSEMVNPVQLLFGNFDLAFVILYILPLLIIAFTFNVLSKEKELGTIRLLGAQPISMIKWLLQKMIIRFIIFTLITLIVLLVIIAVFSPDAFLNAGSLISVFLLIAGYSLFWFVISIIVNLKINDSSKNAFALIATWLLIVLILPATINQIGNSLYPTPSRLKMINEIRLIKKENEEKQNEIMDSFLRDHPELAQENETQKFGFWHKYFASEKVMEEKQIMGVTLGIVSHDSILFSGGLGYADFDEKRKADNQSLFRMGSLTKSFVALGIMKLVEKEQLKLTDELKKSHPKFLLLINGKPKIQFKWFIYWNKRRVLMM